MTTKAESRRRTAIKKALEADGYGVVVQHGSAYSPNIPDLLVVLAALEVKMDDGELRVGQRNRIRRFRRQGIPAGVVRSVAEARQGMALIKQGAYQVADNDTIDLSFLDQYIQDQPAAAPAAPAAEPEPITEVLGMAGQFQTFDPEPAADPELVPHQDDVRADLESVLKRNIVPPDGTVIASPQAPLQVRPPAAPASGFGILEHIAQRLDDIYGLLADIAEGVSSEDPQPAAQPPVRRARRGRPPKTEE